jgi:hypothetical protein
LPFPEVVEVNALEVCGLQPLEQSILVDFCQIPRELRDGLAIGKQCGTVADLKRANPTLALEKVWRLRRAQLDAVPQTVPGLVHVEYFKFRVGKDAPCSRWPAA